MTFWKRIDWIASQEHANTLEPLNWCHRHLAKILDALYLLVLEHPSQSQTLSPRALL